MKQRRALEAYEQGYAAGFDAGYSAKEKELQGLIHDYGSMIVEYNRLRNAVDSRYPAELSKGEQCQSTM